MNPNKLDRAHEAIVGVLSDSVEWILNGMEGAISFLARFWFFFLSGFVALLVTLYLTIADPSPKRDPVKDMVEANERMEMELQLHLRDDIRRAESERSK